MTAEGSAGKLVVVGVDGSNESVAALRWAGEYAAATRATLRAVLAWHYPAAVGGAPVGVAPQVVSEEVRQNMATALSQTVTTADPGVPVDQLVTYGHPVQVLVEASKEADLLVVGRRGHAAIAGMQLGSVSIHCVTHAHCPVVVVEGDD